jgi:hypothetical protein
MIKKMNTSQNKIPIAEFREMKFVPAVLLLKTDLNPATQQRERQPETITRRNGFAREWKILRAGSERVSSFGPLVQSLLPRPLRSLGNRARRGFVNLRRSREK